MCETLEATIPIAKKNAKSGDVVLFSPASASLICLKILQIEGIILNISKK